MTVQFKMKRIGYGLDNIFKLRKRELDTKYRVGVTVKCNIDKIG